MPQDPKAHPTDADSPEVAPGTVHENLEGWIPPLASDEEIRVALEKAFSYRGDVTITRKDGSTVEGYIFDRRDGGAGASLSHCIVRLLPKDSNDRVSIPFDQIARLEFTGR